MKLLLAYPGEVCGEAWHAVVYYAIFHIGAEQPPQYTTLKGFFDLTF
jgi:hypothetical protein